MNEVAYKSSNHPELQPGEVWVTNGDEVNFDNTLLQSRRQGSVAYDVRGEPLADMFPIFAQKSEVDAFAAEGRDIFSYPELDD